MSTLIGILARWRRLWQQPFVRLLGEKYRKFRWFLSIPFSLAFLFARSERCSKSLLKKEKRTFYRISDYVRTQEMEDIRNLKKDWKKLSKGGTNSFHLFTRFLMESLIQSSPNSFDQYLPTPGYQPLFSTTVSLHP